MRVVVIGAGIAGLVAARALCRRALHRRSPLEIRVLEAGPRAGGHIGTIREDGFLVETGPNGFLSGKPATDALIADLGLGSALVEAQAASRRRYLAWRGDLYRLPAGPLGLFTTRTLSIRGRIRIALEPWIPARRGEEEETVLEFGRRRFGREAAEVVGDAVVAGTSGGSAATVSVNAAYPKLPELERRYGSVVRGMMARRRDQSPTPRLLSLANGMGTLPETIASELGSTLSVGEPVTGLTRDGTGWLVKRAAHQPLRADQVVVAVASAEAARLLQASEPGLAGMLRTVPGASLVLVALAWKAADLDRPLDGYGYLVPAREQLLTLGMVWESSLFPGRAPGGWVVVRVLLGGARAPEAIELSDGEVFRRAEAEAAPFLGVRRPPSRRWLLRWPAAIPQYLKGHRERIATIRRTAPPGLEFCGSSYEGISLSSAVASGAAAAERIPLG